MTSGTSRHAAITIDGGRVVPNAPSVLPRRRIQMTDAESIAVALRYVEYLKSGDESVLEEAFSPDFFDHVSGRRGVEIMRIVRRWIDESFGDAEYFVHAVTTNDDLVMLWFSSRPVARSWPKACTSFGWATGSWRSIGPSATISVSSASSTPPCHRHRPSFWTGRSLSPDRSEFAAEPSNWA